MKLYHLNKKEILYWAEKARKFLNLPKIKINIWTVNDFINTEHSVFFNCEERYINLTKFSTKLIIERATGLISLLNKDLIIFSIFHEFAHYFQFYYYGKWFNKFRQPSFYSSFEINYSNQKLEKNADKIATIMFKELVKKEKS